MTGALVKGRGPTIGDARPARVVHTTSVVTPEAVLLEFRAAGIGSRVMAKGVDVTIQMILFSILFIPIGVVAAASGTLGTILGIVLGFVVFFGYPVLEAVRSGQTPGKAMFGLRVITTEGGPVLFRHAALRSIIGVAEFFVIPGGLLALVAALVSRRSQRIGDLAAGTLVVRIDRRVPRPIFFPPVYGAEQFSRLFDAGGLRVEQFAVIRDYMLRYRDLSPDAAARLAQSLAEALQRSGATPRPPSMSYEHYVMAAAFAYQQRFSFDDGSTAAPVLPTLTSKYGTGYTTAAPPPPGAWSALRPPVGARDAGPGPSGPPMPPSSWGP